MIKDNIEHIRHNIELACKNAGRSAHEVTLVAVSKTKSVDQIQEAYSCGIRNFGENYVQEALDKIPLLKTLCPDISFHFIGHLQSNKSKLIYEHVDCIQTLDSLKLAKKLNALGEVINRKLNVLVQINTSQEPQKSGIEPGTLAHFLNDLTTLPWLRVSGLMTIGSLTNSESLKRQEFGMLRQLMLEMRKKGFSTLTELSMGMSSDFELAINEGATIIRVGTNIFGNRT